MLLKTVKPQTPSILLIAAETSGDILASYLVQGLRLQGCNLPIWGIGGKHLKALGMSCVADIDELAVRGYIEVLSALPRLLMLQRTIKALAHHQKPVLCITVDAPDFNLEIARYLKSIGVPTVHFISPSVWAWRKERLPKIKEAVDLMLCLFPHEPAIYHQIGMKADYVGHPMAQVAQNYINYLNNTNHTKNTNILNVLLKQDINTIINRNINNYKVIALLPGSRKAEITYILPRLLEAALIISRKMPNTVFILPIASESLLYTVNTMIDAFKFKHNPNHSFNLYCINGHANTVLASADVGIIASGTATLEAALYELPMVICYAMPYLSYLKMKGKNYLPWVGLPNILLKQSIVPELLQDKATPEALADATLTVLNDKLRYNQIKQQFQNLRRSLNYDTTLLAAQAIIKVLKYKI